MKDILIAVDFLLVAIIISIAIMDVLKWLLTFIRIPYKAVTVKNYELLAYLGIAHIVLTIFILIN